MQKRYWLRGGVTLGLLDLVLVFLNIAFNPASGLILALNIVQGPFSYLLYPILNLDKMRGNIPILVVGGLICWFIIGAIFGWLYGRIKNRKISGI